MIRTVLSISSNQSIPAKAYCSIVTRPQVRIQPYQLFIYPDLAQHFTIHDIKNANRSVFPQSGDIPATHFARGRGCGLDMGIVGVCQDVMIFLTNHSDEPRMFHAAFDAFERPRNAHNERDVRALLGEWQKIVGHAHARFDEIEQVVNNFEATRERGDESIGTEIDQIRGVTGRPAPIIREIPSFGWDPYGDE